MYSIGVDVGSGSVRAGLFSDSGDLVKVATKEILVNNPEPGYYEQSSEDIWDAVVTVVKKIIQSVDASLCTSIAFCATCSLVAVDENGKPVSISKSGDPKWNIVMWMDHRAEAEAEMINRTSHKVLDYVGGKISLEMETPKLLWLKKNLPQSYSSTREYFDLGDFLRWKATGSGKRSVCTVVCKWTHVNSPQENMWDKSYFQLVGLEDALPKIGNEFSFPSDSDVICPVAAKELGLTKEMKVGFSMIDAHSGVLGMLGCTVDGGESSGGQGRLALICGTSNCHMALNKNACMVPGVWGPYYGVILKDLYLNEGGQSAAGKLLDHVVMSHVAYPDLLKEVGSHGKVLSKLEEMLKNFSESELCNLTKDLHVWPDFHGNRSPIADPTLKGMMSGLTLSPTRDDLALIYLATIQSLAYGSRLIMDRMEEKGFSFKELVICGGLTKSKLFLQMHADILNLPVLVPDCSEPVLLGAAISASAATTPTRALTSVMQKMAGKASIMKPNGQSISFHTRKYKVFNEMVKDQLKYRQLMKDA